MPAYKSAVSLLADLYIVEALQLPTIDEKQQIQLSKCK